jgi:hypothetical protein
MKKLLFPIIGILALTFVLSAFCHCNPSESKASNSIQEAISELKAEFPELSIDSPQILTPISGYSTYENFAVLQWTSVEASEKYEILVSRQEDFSDSTSIFTTDTIYRFEGGDLNRGIVFWKVRSVQKNNKFSSWSNYSNFNLLGKINVEIQENITRPCNGDCGHCSNPCGRRRSPE